MVGSAKKLTTRAVDSSIFQINGSTVVMMSNMTGKSEEKKLLNAPGRSASASFSDLKVSNGTDRMFFTVFENKGPAMRIAGMAIVMPYSKVKPMFAWN